MTVNEASPARTWDLTRVSAAASAVFMVALFVAYHLFKSKLALAQAADSLLDCLGLAVLAWTVRVAHSPADEGHPFGHAPAEPLGALVIAVLAGVLGFEVGRSALMALWSKEAWHPSGWLLALFGGKAAFKTVVFSIARHHQTPALRAVALDARNDMATSSVAVFGFFAARWGYPAADAALALPLALWIIYSAVALARENVQLLMGAAPPSKRQEELLELIRAMPGVVDAHHLRAHFLGALLFVHVHVVVEETNSLRVAHDIGEGVRNRIEAEPDVVACSVHIDVPK